MECWCWGLRSPCFQCVSAIVELGIHTFQLIFGIVVTVYTEVTVEVGYQIEVFVIQCYVEADRGLGATVAQKLLVIAVQHAVTVLVYEAEVTGFCVGLHGNPVAFAVLASV